MFSYRHAFHAGNHADVLKHFVLIQLLQYMNRKDTAYSYIDTHAGAGVYQLDGEYAAKSGESATGIGPLWERDDLPAALAEYVDLIRGMNPSGKLRFYPGSPYCAEQVAREQDRLRLYEMHPTDFKLLTDNFRKLAEHEAAQGKRPAVRGQRVLVTRADGFQSLKALLPPPSRRAVVLCDPPYEDKQDYRKVIDMLQEALKRFPGGTYAVWYPILQRIEARNFAEKLKHMPGTEWLNVTLTIRTPGPDGFGGLHSSGMFIINPPYTLEATLRQVMPYLVDALGVDAGAAYVLESGLAATTPRLTATPHADGPRAAASPRSSGKRAGAGRPEGAQGQGGRARRDAASLAPAGFGGDDGDEGGNVYTGGKARGGRSAVPRGSRGDAGNDDAGHGSYGRGGARNEDTGRGGFGRDEARNVDTGRGGYGRGAAGAEDRRGGQAGGGHEGGGGARGGYGRGGDHGGRDSDGRRGAYGRDGADGNRPGRGGERSRGGYRDEQGSGGQGAERAGARQGNDRYQGGSGPGSRDGGGARVVKGGGDRYGNEGGGFGGQRYGGDARRGGDEGGGRPNRARPSGMGGSGAADGQRGGRPSGKPFVGTGRSSGPRNGPRKG